MTSIYPDINPTWYSDAGQVTYTAPCPGCGTLCDWTAKPSIPMPLPHCPHCAPNGGAE